MEDLSRFCCLNPRCIAFGRRNFCNLRICEHIGKGKNIRRLQCLSCQHRFSERKGTVFYRSHTPEEKVVGILQHVQEGNGMRKTGRLMGVKEDTVIRYVRLAGEHAVQLHEQLVAFSPADSGAAVG